MKTIKPPRARIQLRNLAEPFDLPPYKDDPHNPLPLDKREVWAYVDGSSINVHCDAYVGSRFVRHIDLKIPASALRAMISVRNSQ